MEDAPFIHRKETEIMASSLRTTAFLIAAAAVVACMSRTNLPSISKPDVEAPLVDVAAPRADHFLSNVAKAAQDLVTPSPAKQAMATPVTVTSTGEKIDAEKSASTSAETKEPDALTPVIVIAPPPEEKPEAPGPLSAQMVAAYRFN
jgi:hypothetical protein